MLITLDNRNGVKQIERLRFNLELELFDPLEDVSSDVSLFKGTSYSQECMLDSLLPPWNDH